MIQFSRDRFSYKAPEEIVVLESMRINAVGKVNRVRLKEMAKAGII